MCEKRLGTIRAPAWQEASMSVQAKLFVSSVRRQVSSPDSVEITLAAVTQGEENKSWAEATPAAKFEMSIQNPDAVVQFPMGQEFLVTFEPIGTAPSLGDGHPYEETEYERLNGDKYGGARCERCKAKRLSHEEPVRSKLVRILGQAEIPSSFR